MNGNKKLTALFLLVFFNLVFVSANQLVYESYFENVDIESKNSVHEEVEAIINLNETQELINFSLTPRISNLKVSLDSNELRCEIYEKIGKTDILCFFEKPISGKHFLEINFDSSYPLVNLKKDQTMFISNYNPIIKTKEFVYILRLPLGHAVYQESGKEKTYFITPNPDEIYSDGQRIILKWEKLKLETNFEVSVIYEPFKKSFNLFWIALILMPIIIFIFLLFYFKKKIKREKTKITKSKKISSKTKKNLKKGTIEEHLIESEKAIINELKNTEKKELRQKQLQLKTGFSKAKLSRIIGNLESRNFIKKVPFGNTNIIKLKTKYF